MIGLAVGIDYGLFVVTRHRRQLAHGMSVPESIAQALATAGSAVVFAGVTVIIALCGLAVAQIPFLSVMGWAAASGVAIAVAAALTLLPALLGIFGEHLRPKPTSRTTKLASAATTGQKTMGGLWVAIVTKVPAVTVIVILIGIGVMVIPIKDLELALPDNGSADVGSPERTSFDLIAKEFGPGYNSPLSGDGRRDHQRRPEDHGQRSGHRHREAARGLSPSPSRPRTRPAISGWSGWCPSGRRATPAPPPWWGRSGPRRRRWRRV